MLPAIFYIVLGVVSFTALSALWAYVSVTRRFVCALMADSLLNGAVLFLVISVMLAADALKLVEPPDRTAINIIFTSCAVIVQVQIVFVHRAYHRIVGEREP